MGAKCRSLKKSMAVPPGIEPPNPWSQGKNANHLATETGASPRKIHSMTLIRCQGTTEWMAISVWTSHNEMFACRISGSTLILFDPSNILQTIDLGVRVECPFPSPVTNVRLHPRVVCLSEKAHAWRMSTIFFKLSNWVISSPAFIPPRS